MCYHAAVSKTKVEIENHYNAHFAESSEFKPIYHGNAFANIKWPIITLSNPNLIQLYHWGLIPFWIKNIPEAKKIRTQTLNAMSETVFEKPSFRHTITKQRCLVITTGFFEWYTQGKNKYPFFISLKEKEIFSMAGVYDSFSDIETGEIIQSFSILTTEANSLLAKIHNSKKRMPVILKREDEKKWLDNSLDKSSLQKLMIPYDAIEMNAISISKLITSKNDNSNSEAVTEEYIYEELRGKIY